MPGECSTPIQFRDLLVARKNGLDNIDPKCCGVKSGLSTLQKVEQEAIRLIEQELNLQGGLEAVSNTEFYGSYFDSTFKTIFVKKGWLVCSRGEADNNYSLVYKVAPSYQGVLLFDSMVTYLSTYVPLAGEEALAAANRAKAAALNSLRAAVAKTHRLAENLFMACMPNAASAASALAAAPENAEYVAAGLIKFFQELAPLSSANGHGGSIPSDWFQTVLSEAQIQYVVQYARCFTGGERQLSEQEQALSQELHRVLRAAIACEEKLYYPRGLDSFRRVIGPFIEFFPGACSADWDSLNRLQQQHEKAAWRDQVVKCKDQIIELFARLTDPRQRFTEDQYSGLLVNLSTQQNVLFEYLALEMRTNMGFRCMDRAPPSGSSVEDSIIWDVNCALRRVINEGYKHALNTVVINLIRYIRDNGIQKTTIELPYELAKTPPVLDIKVLWDRFFEIHTGLILFGLVEGFYQFLARNGVSGLTEYETLLKSFFEDNLEKVLKALIQDFSAAVLLEVKNPHLAKNVVVQTADRRTEFYKYGLKMINFIVPHLVKMRQEIVVATEMIVAFTQFMNKLVQLLKAFIASVNGNLSEGIPMEEHGELWKMCVDEENNRGRYCTGSLGHKDFSLMSKYTLEYLTDSMFEPQMSGLREAVQNLSTLFGSVEKPGSFIERFNDFCDETVEHVAVDNWQRIYRTGEIFRQGLRVFYPLYKDFYFGAELGRPATPLYNACARVREKVKLYMPDSQASSAAGSYGNSVPMTPTPGLEFFATFGAGSAGSPDDDHSNVVSQLLQQQ